MPRACPWASGLEVHASAAALAAAATTPGYDMGMTGYQTGTWTLIDPVTQETISAETKSMRPATHGRFPGQAVKTNRDYWFKLQFKLK